MRSICEGTSGLAPAVEEQYRKLWVGMKFDEPMTFDCVYRGGALRSAPCKLCGNREVSVEVHACRIHGECTIHAHGINGKSGKIAVCIACPDRPDAAVLDRQ